MSSGQPRVEKGHRPLENQVSSTSSSCRSSVAPHSAQALGSCLATVTCPFGQYHAGIRCPHQSWRDTHQSRMPSIQVKKVLA